MRDIILNDDAATDLATQRERTRQMLQVGNLKEAFLALAAILGKCPDSREKRVLFETAFTRETRPDHIALLFAAAMLENGDTELATHIFQLVRKSASREREFFVTTPNDNLPAYCAAAGYPQAFVSGFQLVPVTPGHGTASELPSFVCGLPGGRVAGLTHLPISADGHLFVHRIAFNPIKIFRYDAGDASDEIAVPAHSRYVIRASALGSFGPAILMGHTRNVGHWFLNHVARLALIEGRPDLQALPVIVGQDPSPFNLETLERMGIGRERIVCLRPGQLAQFEMLWVPSQLFCQIDENPTLYWNPNAIHFIRRKLGVGNPKPGRRRLFITRRNAQWRRVANEDEVFEKLRPMGFELIELGGLTLAAQIELAADAAIIVGAYGNGMNLTLLAPCGIPVVELGFPELRLRIQHSTCSVLSQPFQGVDGVAGYRGRSAIENDFTVDPNIVAMTVKSALQ